MAGTVPKIWSSCTHFMMHKFKPAEFHAATCCGVKILSPKTRNLFIKSSQIRGLASALCPCFTTHKLKPAEFNATCCRDKFCPHNRFFNTTQRLPGRGEGGDLASHLVPASCHENSNQLKFHPTWCRDRITCMSLPQDFM